VAGATLVHGPQDFYLEARIPPALNLRDHFSQMLQAPQGEVFRLDGDDGPLRGHQGVHRQNAEARRAVQEDEVVFLLKWREGCL